MSPEAEHDDPLEEGQDTPADERQESVEDAGQSLAVTTDETLPQEQVDGVDPDSELDDDEKPLLSIEVKVAEPSACERHVVVSISRDDIERYKDNAFEELMPTAQVPGFRPGHAPRKLVEKRFRGDVDDQVKGSLVMDAMTQVSDQQDFSAISEPDFDFDAVQLDDEGPLVFEFKVEVRPEFQMPDWQGLKLNRVSHEYSDKEVQDRTQVLLQRYGTLESHDGPVQQEDLVTIDIVCSDGDEEISRLEGSRCPVRPKLVFRDGEIDGFDKLVIGATLNSTLKGSATVSESHQDEALQGKSLDVAITISQIERISLPELTSKFLGEVGDFESIEEMHDAVREELQRQLEYHRDQQIRGQITDLLTESADWELPPALLQRQAQRELQRSILELQSSGFSNDEIRMHMNRIQHDLQGNTARALKEHFILERIAEDNDLDVSPEELDLHIDLLARQQNVSSRRIRARLEKQGDMDALRNQVIERKAIGLINEHADFTDVPLEETSEEESFAISHDIAGEPPVLEAPQADDVPETEVQESEAETSATEEVTEVEVEAEVAAEVEAEAEVEVEVEESGTDDESESDDDS